MRPVRDRPGDPEDCRRSPRAARVPERGIEAETAISSSRRHPPSASPRKPVSGHGDQVLRPGRRCSSGRSDRARTAPSSGLATKLVRISVPSQKPDAMQQPGDPAEPVGARWSPRTPPAQAACASPRRPAIRPSTAKNDIWKLAPVMLSGCRSSTTTAAHATIRKRERRTVEQPRRGRQSRS